MAKVYRNTRFADLTEYLIKGIIGTSWFEVQLDTDVCTVESHEFGDVGEAEPGQKDIVEGKRIYNVLSKALPLVSVRVSAVDEWIIVTLRELPPDKIQERINQVQRAGDGIENIAIEYG